MMNLGVVLPEPGYLEAVREITDAPRRRPDLRRGQDRPRASPPGGATERFGVQPDMVTLAKALGGGLPTGAIGMTEEVRRVVEDGTVYQVGTYNGNPLGMAATRANLLEVMTPDAYAHLDHLNDRILAGCNEVDRAVRPAGLRRRHRLQGLRHVLADRRSSTTRRSRPTRTPSSSELAWLFNMNRGIFMTPGREEEWTLSVTHTDEAVDALRRGASTRWPPS